MSDLNIALVLRFIDQATAPARAAMQNVQVASEAVQRHGETQMARGRAMQETARQQTTALRGSTLATVGMGFAFYRAMQPAIAFEAQMSRVGAIAGANEDQQRALARAALEQGSRTRFSASEAAQGLEKLAAAGLDVEQSIEGLPGVLDLAAASGVSLRDTADFVTNITSGFGLQVADMARVGDVLVNTFTSSNTTLESVAATMGYAAPAASRLGIEIEQVAAMTGLLGDQAISGERAGTALRGIMARLSGPSTEASRAFEQMNIQLADADGNLRALPEIFADMNTAMADMGSATRGDLMNTIFGMQAANEAAILIDAAGTGALQNYTEQLRETGTASNVAARMSDNARGAMDRLRSVTEATQIALGNGLLPVLVDMAEKAMPFIAAAGEWIVANQELVTTIGGIVAGLLLMNIAVLAAQWGFWLLFGWVGKLVWAYGALVVGIGKILGALAALPAVLALVRGVFMRLSVIVASLAGTILGFLVRQLLNLALIVVWLGRVLVTLAARGLMLAMAGFRLLGAAALWLGRSLVALATQGAVMAAAGFRMVGAAVAWLGRALLIAGRAMLINPLFLAIAAIAGAAYLIYQNWDGIVEYFSEKIDRVRAAFDDGLLNGVFALIAEFNPFTLQMDAAEALFTYLTGWTFAELGAALIEFIGFDPFAVLVASAESLFTYLTGWTFDDVSLALQSAFDIDLLAAGTALMQSLWEGMLSILADIMDEVADFPGAVGAVIASGATALWSTGVALIQSLWDGAVAKFNEFISWVSGIPGRIIAAIGNIDLSGVIRWPSMPSWLGGAANTDAPPDHADIVQRSEAAGWTRPAGSRALGGPVRPGFLYEINEQGQEYFMPDSPGRVIPAGAVEAAQAANGPDAGRNQIIERLRMVTERVVVAPLATAQTADAARPPLPLMPAAAQAMEAIERGGPEGPGGLWGMLARFLPGAAPALATAAPFAMGRNADAARSPLPQVPAAAPMMQMIERAGGVGLDALRGMMERVTSSDEGMRPSSLPQMMGREGSTAPQKGGFSIGDIHIHAAAGMDPRAIAEQVRRVIRDEARTAGYALHDGGLHAT